MNPHPFLMSAQATRLLSGAMGVVLLVACVPPALAQSRTLFKDPLLRQELDPTSKLDGAPAQPVDKSKEALHYPDDTPAWKQFLEKYGQQHTMVYLGDWEKRVKLPDPPANTSERTKAELDAMLKLQWKRTDQHRKDITREIGNGLDSLGWLLDGHFNLKKMPATEKLLANAMQDVLAAHLTLKKKYLRPRPSALDSRIKPCIEVPPYPAYPSGHSTQMHALAYIFTDLIPEGKADFEREAFRVAWDREMAGLHYSSDTAAGRLLAMQLMDILRAEKNYQADFEAAKKEWGAIKMKP